MGSEAGCSTRCCRSCWPTSCEGTGRYNVSRGLVSTVQGIGGSLSHAAAGAVVVGAGYAVAFLGLALIAVFALLLVALVMPETRLRGEEPLSSKPPAQNP